MSSKPSWRRAILALALALPAADAAAQPYFTRTQVLNDPTFSNVGTESADVDGEWAVMGTPFIASDLESSAFVYRKVAGTWTQVQRLRCPESPCSSPKFGTTVAVSGTTMAVASESSNRGVAAIYIYGFDGSSWVYQTKLLGATGKLVGHSMDLEGNYLVTSAEVNNNHAGWTAYVFQRSGSTWTRTELVGTDRLALDLFGYAVRISGDSICVGAPGSTTASGRPPNPGGVHMFRRSGSGWAQEGPRLAPLSTAEAGVGKSCDIDGNTLAVGTPSVFVQGQNSSGRAFIYTRTGTTWSLQQTIMPETGVYQMGEAIALHGDGLVIGAPGSGSTIVPTAVLFARVGTTWTQRGKAEIPFANAIIGDTVATDGASIFIGGYKFHSNEIGVALVYGPSATPPIQSGPPGPPVSFQASVSGNGVSMSWGTPSSGAPPTGYTLVARQSSGGAILANVPLGNVTSFAATAPNGVYVLSVRAANASGTGPESNTVTITVPAAAPPPGTPTNLVANVSGNAATFTWNAPASGGPATGYLLAAGTSPSFAVPLAVVPLPATPRSVSVSAIPAGRFYVRILAQNAGGVSGPSNEVTFTVAGATPPGAPTLNAPTVSGTTVGLSWSAGSGGAPTSYVLAAAASSGGAPFATATFAGTSVTIPNVPRGTYFLRLVAANAAGTSPGSNEVTLVVP